MQIRETAYRSAKVLHIFGIKGRPHGIMNEAAFSLAVFLRLVGERHNLAVILPEFDVFAVDELPYLS
jgi:hypothetical protein